MGIYSHLSLDELQATRARLQQSLTDRLTTPTIASHSNGGQSRSAHFAQDPEKIRKELREVCAEIDQRTGAARRGPIYIV